MARDRTSGGAAGAGWWVDPARRHQLRYHDGAAWTMYVLDDAVPDADPLPVAMVLPPPDPLLEPLGAPRSDAPEIRRKHRQRKAQAKQALTALVALGVAATAAIVAWRVIDDRRNDDDAATTTTVATASVESTPVSGPAAAPTAAPTTVPSSLPIGSAGPVAIGQTVQVEGAFVRVNTVRVVSANDAVPVPADQLVVEVEIEACAGNNGFGIDEQRWLLARSDTINITASAARGDLPLIGLGPGGCVRGIVGYEMPLDDATPVAVALTGPDGAELGRWAIDGDATTVTSPAVRLAPPVGATTVALGQPATFGPGHTATVRGVTDAAAPLDPAFAPAAGRQYAQLDVELCAGTETLTVSPLYWLVTTTDWWMGESNGAGDTLAAADVAPGGCVSGLVQVSLPAGSVSAQAVLVGAVSEEIVRWQVT